MCGSRGWQARFRSSIWRSSASRRSRGGCRRSSGQSSGRRLVGGVAARPDVLVITRQPDFTHRVARRVRAAAPDIPIVDYVSPSVLGLASGPRARHAGLCGSRAGVASFRRRPSHERLGGPPCSYVGHPLSRAGRGAGARTPRRRRARAAGPPVVLVLPGSRSGEIARHLEVSAPPWRALADPCGRSNWCWPTVPPPGRTVRQPDASWRVRPHRGRAGGQWAAFRVARLGARGLRHGDARACGRRRPHRRRLQGALAHRLIYRAAVRVPTIVLANLVLGQKCHAGDHPARGDARAARRRAGALIGDTPEAATGRWPPSRGSTP